VDSCIEYLVIGRILRPFGIGGEVKLLPITDDIGRFRDIRFVYLETSGGFQREAVERVRITNNAVFIKLETIGSRDDAEELREKFVYVDREHAATIDDSSYYYYDIQGCTVKTVQGEVIGRVFDIQNAGSCDVYFVRPEGSPDGEILIPAVRDVIRSIDTRNKEILIDPIDGLL